MAIWSILRPRRYDGAVASQVLAAVRETPPEGAQTPHPVNTVSALSRAYG